MNETPRSCGVWLGWAVMVLLGGLLAGAVQAEGSRIHDRQFFSEALQREMPVSVVAPSDPAVDAPVLVLLHGRGRTHRSLVDVSPSCEDLLDAEMWVILPQGEDGWYINSPVRPADRYEDYLSEVIAFAKAEFGLAQPPSRWAITGWSMGGYGAVRYATQYPERFGAVSAMIGLLDFPRVETLPEGQNYEVPVHRFGDNEEQWQELNPIHSIESLRGKPLLVLTADIAFDRTMNENFSAELDRSGIPHRYLELEGGHTFPIVQQAVPEVLEFVRQTVGVVESEPSYRSERVLASVPVGGDDPYLAFPSVLDLGDEVLVSFKRGGFHGGGADAGLDLLRLDKRTDKVTWEPGFAYQPGKTTQMGEWVRYPDGTIANWIDMQRPPGTERDGMQGVLSPDGGRTFGPLVRFGEVDGMEFGYPFGSVVEGDTIWMVVMSFSHLAGGYSVIEKYPHAGPVCIIRSDDSGESWSLVRNLTQEFGDIPINESYFVRAGEGFLVVTRGYDQRVRLHRTDDVFKVQRQADLTATYDFIERYVGRPRLFTKDGGFYLIGRNWTGDTAIADDATEDRQPRFPKAMKLCLFRVSPESLAVESYAILDNAEAANVTDAYYPAPYWVERDGETYLRVVDYKGVDRRPPEIVEFEFRWSEVR